MTLEVITSRDLRPLRHGFFTRKGGASSGVFEGLNCGVGSSDQSDIVRINRARVAETSSVLRTPSAFDARDMLSKRLAPRPVTVGELEPLYLMGTYADDA